MSKTITLLATMAMTLAFATPSTAQQRQLLHDGWTFRQARLPISHPATVPGVVHTDLMRLGLIDDPYIALNERGVQWVDKEDWVYETTFRPEQSVLTQGHVDLCFDGLDTYADVYLNDSLILKADNMFRRWRVAVKTLLRNGDNHLRVCFHSPVKIDMPKWEQQPYRYQAANDQSENGGLLDRKLSVFARKAGYHYGWDWGPRLVTSGIWRDVWLEAWSGMRISDVHLRQRDVSERKAVVTDVVEVEADDEVKQAVVTVVDQTTGRQVASRKCQLKKGLNTIPVEFTLRNPRLWWCNGLGKPELYTFTTTVSADEKKASLQNRIGLRSVRLVTDADADGLQQFYFVLNGVPVFAKGTNYIPQDNFLTNVTPERYRQTIRDAVMANMNMIRVWGGGIYEDDLFYDLCDEMGLMVWQDFMFACSTYPAQGQWLESVRMEAADNLRRLRNHPSIVVWCGGNECTDAWYNWGWRGRMMKTDPEGAALVEQQQEHLYYEVLRQVTDEHAPDDVYVFNSPLAAPGRGSDGINGDRHFYGVGHRRMPVSSYNDEKAHFFSEYGMQSFPAMSTIGAFAPDTASHHIGSDVMMWHQRGGTEANQVIEWYVASHYGQPHDFAQFVYASQLLQGDAMRTAIEAHRRDRPHCMGSLLWQHNDCWPVASWSTRDYYGRWKAAHYMVRQAFAPLLCSAVTLGDSLQVSVVSDLRDRLRGQLRLTVYTLSGECVGSSVHDIAIPANTSSRVLSMPLDALLHGYSREQVVVNMSLSTGKTADYQANVFLCQQRELQLLHVQPRMVIEAAEGGCRITLTADQFIRALALSVDDADAWFDNNFFDLLPGQPVSCFLRTSLSPEEVRRSMTMMSLNDIK